MSGDRLITVCVPTFRRPSLLLHTLHSCFIQDYRPLEIDIGDDSPGSETEQVVRSLTVPAGISIRYQRNQPHLGQVGNVNALFGRARGSRLVLLHDDDLLLPGAITALDDAFSMSGQVVAAYGHQEVILENGEVSEKETVANSAHANRLPHYTGIQSNPVVCALWRQFPNDGFLIESTVAREIAYRDVAAVGNANDLDFAIRLAIVHRRREFVFLNRVTSQYRLSAGSIRALNDTCRRMYEVVQQLVLISAEEIEARNWLLEKIAEEAVVDNALLGDRRAALRIFFSSHYPRLRNPFKSVFHLAIIGLPRLYHLRIMMEVARTRGFMLR
jgi:glycosyltransferase involved in cell wall biosynthesis